jgi:hypothetical protein
MAPRRERSGHPVLWVVSTVTRSSESSCTHFTGYLSAMTNRSVPVLALVNEKVGDHRLSTYGNVCYNRSKNVICRGSVTASAIFQRGSGGLNKNAALGFGNGGQEEVVVEDGGGVSEEELKKDVVFERLDTGTSAKGGLSEVASSFLVGNTK